jgi:hypothetical protein
MSAESEYKGRQYRPIEPEADVLFERPDDDSFEQSRRQAIAAKGRTYVAETETTRQKVERTKILLLASRVENVLKDSPSSAGEEFRKTFDALFNRLLQAEEALHTAQLEHLSEIRAVKRSLSNEYSRGLESLRQLYESELAKRTQEIERRLTAEFMAELASAKAAGKPETEVPLSKSILVVPSSMLGTPSKWKKRTRLFVPRMGWVERAREGMQLAYANREWLFKRREALKIDIRPWKDSIVRLKSKFRNQLSH